jgi:hypothetical protein
VGIGTGVLHKSGSDLSGLDNAQLDDTDTTYTVRGGYRFSPYVAAELGPRMASVPAGTSLRSGECSPSG